MQSKDANVIKLARQIAGMMHSAGDRSDALDAHDMARTFYRRMSIPSHPQTAEHPQPKNRDSSRSA
jgi:hypothetical protein